ncbi:xylulokinase [Portibacter marinus]|uniref:xylulokinase n=1 Tax=Portibacter marinus TaxID=2898660 RepID=UPI001EFF1CD4|nr:FGGY family carbohydrate kinase [Portibacter marinus]
MKYALGIDVGSSSVKVAVVEVDSGKLRATAQYPKTEMSMITEKKSWAEQDPEMWWEAYLKGLEEVGKEKGILANVTHIGISYQMHGLVCVNEKQQVLRPSIIWCDSRAVEIGDQAFKEIGSTFCLGCLLNSPGNFTASKLKWVKENEPEIYKQIHKIMLPGDYIAMKLSGKISTTISGLSEGVFWDFEHQEVSNQIMKQFGFDHDLIPEYYPSFSEHAVISDEIAHELGLNPEVKITYKAGDQPNNALSLNVMEPGEIAATAGTSGVVYGVVDALFVDERQRVNSFAHVNYSTDQQRIGVLLCINGVGISNAWVKRNFGFKDYEEMNNEAESLDAGSEGLFFFPFGNGAERMLGNKNIEASIEGLNYNIHSRAHIARAVQEGIAFAFAYGMEAFKENNIELTTIRAGRANMFLSDLFAQTVSDLMVIPIELYNTDGAIGAARGALIGGRVLDQKQAFSNLQREKTYQPTSRSSYLDIYKEWKDKLTNKLKNNI